ncbi:MAG TPA: DinB family protein, partial [Candidatus Lustribacter sp.]|nr:DinB family protein [Candidatus Lustribacter sp.]
MADEPRTPADPISPDTKDWTWVLTRACADCGFDPAAVGRATVGARIEAALAPWPAVLARDGVRTRPRRGVWSPLEYACHVRDVCRIFAARAGLMREQEDPTFAGWDQDATAIQERYDAQDPAVVAIEVGAASAAAVAAFAAVRAGEWDRTGVRSDGSRFTLETLAAYFLH